MQLRLGHLREGLPSGSKSRIHRDRHQTKTSKELRGVKTFASRDTGTSYFLKSRFSQEKGKSSLCFMWQFDMCQSIHGSHGKDVLLAAVQAGRHMFPPEDSGLAVPEPLRGMEAATPALCSHLLRQGCAWAGLILQMRKLSQSMIQTCSQDSLVTEFNSHSSSGLCPGHPQTWASVLSDI